MYNNDYDEYMRSVLGYPTMKAMNTYNAYGNDTYMNNESSYFPYRNQDGCNNMNNSRFVNVDYESLYPDIYMILRPMVGKICDNNRYRELSKESINEMANEIYANIENDESLDIVNVNVTTNSVQEAEKNVRKDMKILQKQTEVQQNRNCCGNPILKDLIKIMIIKQLIGNNNNFPPPHPPRPPFNPGLPGYYYNN